MLRFISHINQKPFVEASIQLEGGIYFTDFFLIDTGSNNSYISNLRVSTHDIKKNHLHDADISGIGGKSTRGFRKKGKLILHFGSEEIKKDSSFFCVTSNLDIPNIIGNDILHQLKKLHFSFHDEVIIDME